MDEPQFVAETLEWCNIMRAEKNKPQLDRLPLGYRGDGYSCPCGAATGLWVGSESYTTPKDADMEYMKDLPSSVREFVAAFDNCKLPQYEVPNPDQEDFPND